MATNSKNKQKPRNKKTKPVTKKKFQKKSYRSFKLSKRIKRDNSDVPSVWKLLLDTYRLLIRHWRKIGGITLVYGILYVLLVRAVPETGLDQYEELIDELGGPGSQTFKTLTLAGVALASSGQASRDVNTIYGLVLFIVVSLAIIWALRHIFADKKFLIRDAYYRGMTPFVTYALMLLLIAIQLLPFALGGLLYALVQSQGIVVSGGEGLLFFILWIVLALLSGFFITNSLMASYAVTLPGMYPWAALKAAKELVAHRRWVVLRKALFLPVLLAALFFVLFLFWIAIMPSTALWFIDISLVLAVPISHTYFYQLYRSLV